MSGELKLAPCWWCGSKKVLRYFTWSGWRGPEECYIECQRCLARSPIGLRGSRVVSRWNAGPKASNLAKARM